MESNLKKGQLEEGVRRLAQGEVIVIPTDTFYGLAADVRRAGAVALVNRVKNKPEDSPILMLAANQRQVEAYTTLKDVSWFARFSKLWPGPLTLILPAVDSLPQPVRVGTTVAVRVPAASIASALAERLGAPITAPSANPHGLSPSTSAEGVRVALGATCPWVLDGGQTPGGAPSTLVDLTGDRPKMIREGAISRKTIELTLGIPIL